RGRFPRRLRRSGLPGGPRRLFPCPSAGRACRFRAARAWPEGCWGQRLPGSWSELCRSWISSLFGAVAQVLYVVVGETFGFPMGGAGLGAALVAHQTGVDQLHLVRAGGSSAVAVSLAEPHAVDAQQGVRLGLYAVQSQFRVEILVVLVKGFGVGVAIHLGDVQHVIDLVERQVAVAVIVQMGLVVDLGLI